MLPHTPIGQTWYWSLMRSETVLIAQNRQWAFPLHEEQGWIWKRQFMARSHKSSNLRHVVLALLALRERQP